MTAQQILIQAYFPKKNSSLAASEQDSGGAVQLHGAREHRRELREGRPDGGARRLRARLVEGAAPDDPPGGPHSLELRRRRAFR